MRLLNNLQRICPVFPPELISAARLVLIGLVFITQVKYQVCRIFIVQFEETTQDRQLTLRAGVCPYIDAIANLKRLRERILICIEVESDVLLLQHGQLSDNGLILGIQNLNNLLEHLNPARHRLLGVLKGELRNQSSSKLALILKRISIKLLFFRFVFCDRCCPD